MKKQQGNSGTKSSRSGSGLPVLEDEGLQREQDRFDRQMEGVELDWEAYRRFVKAQQG
jgi:hypothetical protein